MSYDTTADEKFSEAVEHIKLAMRAINEIVVEECYGYQEVSHADKLDQVHLDLIKMYKLLSK